MSSVIHQNIRYFFPALAEGLAQYYNRAIRIGVIYEAAGNNSPRYIYDPHGVIVHFHKSLLATGCLPDEFIPGSTPRAWHPFGKNLVVHSDASVRTQAGERLAVVVEIPNWSLHVGPIVCWIKHFVRLVVERKYISDFYTSLLNYAPYAVQEATRFVVHGGVGLSAVGGTLSVTAPYLQQVCSVAGQREEGKLATGDLICSEESKLSSLLDRRFSQRIDLNATKHLRKVIQMTGGSEICVACTQNQAIGFLKSINLPSDFVRVSLNGSGVATISAKGQNSSNDELKIATYRKTRFSGVPDKPDSGVIAKDILSYADQQNISFDQKVIDRIGELACLAAGKGHGGMFVIGDPVDTLQGQGQEFDKPLNVVNSDEHNQLVAMSTVDGALMIRASGKVHQVATLVDGDSVQGKYDPSHGARHNSAIRYTSREKEVAVLTISEDGPYSVYIRGDEVSAIQSVEHPMETASGSGRLPLVEDYLRELSNNCVDLDYWKRSH